MNEDRDVVVVVGATRSSTIEVPAPPGSTPGVKIDVLGEGPLDGYAVITIPAAGVLGWEVHPAREVGVVLSGLVAVETDLGTSVFDGCFARYRVPASVRHSLRSLDGPVKILARFAHARRCRGERPHRRQAAGACDSSPGLRAPGVSGEGRKRPGLGAREGRPADGNGVHAGTQRGPSRRLPDVSGGRQWNGDDGQARGGKGVHGEAMREPVRQMPSLGASGRDGRSTGDRGVNAPPMRGPSRKIPNLIGGNEGSTPQPGYGVHAGPMREPARQLPDLGGTGTIGGNGVHRLDQRDPSRQLPDLGGSMRGEERWPNTGKGFNGAGARTRLYETFERLAARLRYVRFACGDWSRVCTKAVTWAHGLTGVFLDPPYSVEGRVANIYAHDSATVAAEVRAWCAENGARNDMRIALCGYGDEHAELERLGWTVVAWKARGGYGNQGDGRGRANAAKERIWFSPACERGDGPLFAGGGR